MKQTCVLLIVAVACALSTCCVTAQNDIYYTECNPYAPPSILSVLGVSGTTLNGFDGTIWLQATINFSTSVQITSGSYNINNTGSDGIGVHWNNEYSGTLESIFTPQLPIAAGAKVVATLSLLVYEGQNNFTMAAQDQFRDQITCFTLTYQMGNSSSVGSIAPAPVKKSVDKKNNNNRARQQKKRSLHAPMTPTRFTPVPQLKSPPRRRRATPSLTRAHL